MINPNSPLGRYIKRQREVEELNKTLDFNLKVTDTITPKKTCAICNKDIVGVSVPDDDKSYHVMCWTKLPKHKENKKDIDNNAK